MKFPELLRILTREPLLIDPPAVESYLQMFQEHATLSREGFDAKREPEQFCGETLPQAEIQDGIMYLPIGGPIGKGLGAFEKGVGCVDCSDICDELQQMEDDP